MFETTLHLLFVKNSMSDDPDWTNPAVDPPASTRRHALDWALAGPVRREQQVHKLQICLTFRDDDDVEVAGTADITLLMEVPASAAAATAAARSSWKKLGAVVGHPHDEVLVADVGGVGTVAIRLTSIAAGATKVFVAVQQWGGT